MNQLEVKRRIIKYLKEHNIPYMEGLCGDAPQITMLYKGCENCPDKVLESSIYFFSDCAECRVYFNADGAEWVRRSNCRNDLFRLFNYINAMIWPCGADGVGNNLYKPQHLYTPRLYMTEDDCFDIVLATVVNYDFYNVAPLETEDFLTACLPELLNNLSIPIFLLLLGKITVERAISIIETKILDKRGTIL